MREQEEWNKEKGRANANEFNIIGVAVDNTKSLFHRTHCEEGER